MKKVTHSFLKSDSCHSFSLFSLLCGILLVALPASLSAQVTFTALDDLSVNAGIQTGLSGGAPTGGVYSGPGAIDDGNGMTYTFNPAVAGVGVHTLSYTVGMNSASDDVEVLNLIPPSFSKSFDFPEIGPGSVTTLTFTINNSASANGVTDLNFIDNLPAGMTIATPANVTSSCGAGIVTAPDGGTTISYTDGTLGAFSTCTITVDVTSSTVGTVTNTTGDLNSSSGNSGTASANLTVATNRPGFSKSFSPATVNFGERSTLTFTVDNTANSGNVISLDFTDNLPAGMVIATPSNASSTNTGTGTFTAVPGTGVISYSSTGFTEEVAAGASVTFSVDVVGNTAGVQNNVTSNLTSRNSFFQIFNCGKASAALDVVTPTEIFLQKSFNPNPAAPGGTTNLEFTITNFSRDFEATNVAFTDDLTAVLAGLTAIGTPINDICGTGSQLSGTTNLTFTGGTIPPEGSCTFSVPLSVPGGAAGGIYTNTTGAITGDLDGSTITGNMANENLTIAYVPTITKEFLNDPIVAGGVTTLEFTITNNDPTNPATDINFTDNIADFLSGATVSSLPAAGSCGPSSLFFTSLIGGDLVFQMINGEIAAGASCTFSIDLLIPTNTSSGVYNNTTSFLSSIIDGDILLGNPASDDLEVLSLPDLSKSFTDDPVDAGDVVNLEFTITYDEFATVNATDVSFTDDLNAVIPGLAAIGLPINDVCGVGSQLSGTTNLSFTGGTMSPGDVCTFSVGVQVPASTLPGSYTNTTSALSATVDGQTGASNAATDDLLIGGLTLTKEFIDDPAIPGDLVTLRFTIDNTTTEDATGIIFTDNLGAVLPGLVAEAPLPTMSCGAGSTLSGTSFLIFTGGEVLAGTSCSFDVNVRVPPGAASGTYTNVTSNLTATINGMPLVLPPAVDLLEVNDNLIALSKTFTDDPVLPGGTVTVEYTLTNLDPLNAISNIAFTDDFDALLTGLQATGLPMSVCGGTVSGTGLLSFTGGSLAAGASCTFSVTLQTPITAPYGGSLPSSTSGMTGEVNGFSVVGDPASDNLDFQLLQFSKSFAGDVEPGGSTILTFTITNPDPVNSVNAIRFTDDLDAVLSGMMATNLPLNGTCGLSSSVTGTSTIVFNDGVLAPSQSCTIDVMVEIPCGSTAGTYLNTTSMITATGSAGVIEGDAATDDLTVLSVPPSNFDAPADLCIDDGVQAAQGGGTPTGGVYSGPGVTDNGNGMDYDFDPAGAGVGVHTITYDYTDTNGCMNSASDDVEVFDLPTVTFTALADLCIDAGVQAAQGGGTPIGGIYSGPGVTDNGNGMTYSFDPMAAGAGVHAITYTYNDGNGCEASATDMVEVFALPTLVSPGDVCITGGVITLNGGSPTGGIYSGPGVIDNGNGEDYDFDPVTAGLGMHTITYDYTGPGCIGSAMATVNVTSPIPISLTIPPSLDTLCVDNGLEVIANAGSPAGGVYSGSGVTDDGNGMSFTFDPAGAGSGLQLITYTISGPGCSGMFTDFIHVFDLPIVTFSIPANQDSFCVGSAPEVISISGNPQGGVYSGPGVTDDGNGTSFTFDASAAGVGFHILTYTFTDAQGCSNSFDDFIYVLGLPTVAFTAPADLCIDAGVQAGLGGGSPTGGVYSGSGVTDDGNGMTYSFDPAGAGVGVHTLTYTFTDGNGCTASASDDVEVFDLPAVTFTALADLCIDAGVQAGLGGGTPTGGVYSGSGVTDDGNGMTYSFDPAAAGAGVHTITYDYTDSNGCSNSASDDVEVFDLPVVTFTALTDLCIDAGVQTGLGGGNPTGGVYSGSGVTDDGNGMTYSFDPAAAGAGVHTITYDYTDSNGCSNSASDDVEVFPLPVVSYTALADLCIDAGVQAGLGGGSPTGGVYSGSGVTDDGNGMTYSFDPASAGVGIHTLTYTFTDGNGCTASASDDVEVFDLPVVTFTALADLCIDAGVQAAQGGGTPTGGVYSGPGVTDDGNGMTYSFDPAAAGAGVHTITYDYTDSNGCSNSASDDVEVFDLPVVTFTALADLCIDAGVQTGLGGGNPTGGVYSGTGVTDDGNGMTYSFDPAAAGAGIHTITYDYTDSNGCSNSASDDVEVFDLPVVSYTALADLCIDAGVQAGLGGGTPTGGVYSGSGVTDDGNGMTYSFDPASAGVGIHTLTYTFTDGNGCTSSASDDVEVFDLPVVTFTALADLCIDAGVQAAQGGGTPTGGVYSGPGVTDDGNGMTYSFDPAAAGAGVHTITYDYTDANGCSNSASDDVEVFDLPVVTFTALADLCIDAGVQTGLGGGNPTGGVYSGSGVTDDGNGMTYSFDPAAAGAGVHTITYDYTDSNGCSNSASDDVEVFDLPVVSYTALADLCIDAGVQAGLGGGSPTGGVYSGSGVTDDGNGMTYSFDPASAGVGIHTLTYTFTDGNGCTSSASDDVEVFDLPVVTFTALADLCIDAGVQAGLGGGSPTGGVYSGSGVTDDGNGMTYSFDPAAAGVGVHTITYDYTDANGCMNSASDDVEVFDLPTADIAAPDDLCIDAGVQTGLGNGTPIGGIYSGPGITDDGNGMTYSLDPAAAGVGVHSITYTYTDPNGCTDAISDDFEVFDLPVVTFTALADLCLDAGVQTGLGGGTPTGGVYSGSGVTDDGNGMTYSFDPASAGVGVHTLTYTFTDGNGCVNSASDDVEVFDLPVVTFTALADLCIDAGVQAGLGGGTPTGGVYSGTGVTDDGNGMTYSFDPAAAGVGVHTITYDYTDANGCMGSASDDVEVFDLPSVLFTALDDLCIDAGVQTMLGMGVPPGGVYSGPGVTDNGNGMDYDFDPAAAGVGVHTITYTYNDTNGCTGSWSDEVEVFDLPVVTFTALADLCLDAGVQAGQGGGTPTGGVYSGSGVTDDGNGMTYSFDPASAGAGVHTLTYTFTDGNGCVNSASDDVEVFDLPVVTFTALADLCIDAGVQTGLGGGSPTGGVYSGSGVTDDGNGETYSFDPASAGLGVHTITYDYTDDNGCTGSASDEVEVFDLPVVSLVTESFHCLDAAIQNLPMTGGIPSGGVYSGIGITDNGNGISYFIDPTVNGVGIVTVTYTYTDANGCSNSATSDIEIVECALINDYEPSDPCQCLDNATPFDCNNNTGGDDGQFSEVVSISSPSGPLPNGMTWSIVGVTGAFDAFNIPAVGMQSAGVAIPGDGSVLLAYNNGVYEVPFVHVDDIGYTLTIEGPFAMGSAANVTLTISNKCQYPDPVFDPTIDDIINLTDPAITLGATDTNGGTADAVTFTIDGNPESMLDPVALGIGVHTVVMTYDGASDGNGGISPDGGTTSASPGCIQEVTKDFEIVDCSLVVDCSNIFDQTLACRADLPPVDFDLPMVTDSCGDVIRSALTIIPGNSGCPNDTVFITRTYFLQDQNGNMAQCMQTFTVISTMDPTFTSFPADTTVLCGASTDPSATGAATGAQECDFFAGDAVVTFADETTPGACPQESTITRTWTVTDACGRSVDQDQVIMIVDTIAPTMVCQNITVELDANGMATASADAVDNGSSDNCGGTVSLSLNMDMFTCANTGTNDVWLIGEDECGNIDSCMAVVTVVDLIAPTITCPGDIVMDNDLGECGAVVTFDVIADDNCDFTVTQTSGIPSGGFYPVGETMNTYVVTDASGLTAECSFLVTVNDTEGPMIDCPNDINVQLEAGECEEIVFFDIPFMDNCGTIDAEMSQLVNDALVSTALDCANNTSNHLRYFENTLSVPIDITQVSFGVFNSGANETVTVNVYMIGPGAPFVYANMVLMGTADFMVPAGMNTSIFTVPVEATIPVGMNYVLELKANNTTNFVIGYNTSGETGSTYISGNNPVPCVSLEPVDIDGLGFPTFAVVLYSNAEGGPFIEQTGGLPSGAYYPLGTTTNTFVATDVYGNTSECTFDVTLVEFSNGVTGVMACNDNINVSLDQNCELILNADMLLEGDVYGCYDDYEINVSGGVGSSIITEPGTYTVTITDPDTGNSCWSTINVESKAKPVIDCAAALCPIDMLEGEWTADDNTFSPGAAWAFDGFAPNNDILYDVIKFVVEVPGVYNLTMTPSDDFDGIAGIYAGSFDPDMPALNLIGGDDDVPGIFESEPDFSIMLEAGTYFLVSSTWGAGQMGIYTWTFTGPGDLLSDCEVKCYELDALLSGDLEIPDPEVTSCLPYELFYSDAVDYSDCGLTVVTRTYLAENANGTSSCEVTFEIEPVSVALDIDLPVQLVELSCNDGTDPEDIVALFDNPLTTDNPNTAIVENNEGYVYAYPTYEVNGHPQKVDNNVCNVYAGYTDQELAACAEGCNGNRKVIRTWTIVDWCTLEISNYIQTIKAVDTEAPTLLTKDVTVSTDAWGCTASFEAPLAWELHDNCDSNPAYRISGPAGVTITGTFEEGYFISGAPKGVHTFNYIAYDCCDNEASYPFTVTVLDITPPVVVAKQNVVISLTSGSTSEDGLAKLYAESIDNGSYDGCSSNVKLEVRRDSDACDIRGNATYNADGHPQDGSPNPNSPSYDPDGGAYVKFCCEDLTNATVDVNGDGELDAGYLKVWLRVWDDGDMDGIFGTAGDNYNEAWAYVKVEDKLAPAIQCPVDVTLTCDMDYTDLNMTGSASAYGSCGGVEVEYNDIIVNLNTCNEGFVRRRWNVVGNSAIFCDQTITLEGLEMPINVSFAQVQDFTAANCPDMIALGEPTWVAGPCEVLGYNLVTDTFKFEDGACYKLVNHWTVINWCEYEPNNPFWNGEGLWEHTQVIKVTDETKPVIEDCEDKMFAINDHSDSDDDGEVCEAKITLTNVATDEGSENCPTGWLKWQVFVDLWGDGTDDLEYSSFLPPFDSNLNNDTNGNGINDRYVSPTANGETVSISLPDIVGSMSNHKVSWKVTDGCNNVTTCGYDFMVVDKKAPTPYCVDLSTAVMESSGTVELWAIDFNVGSFDNCSAQEDLRYTFSDVAPEDDPNYDESQRSSSMVFDCGDVENSPVEVNMYVWDEKGNSDFCIVYLTIVDNTGACGGKPEIGGTVATATGVGVEEVEVRLEAALPEYPRTEMTDEEGGYVFLENALNATYQISGSKDVDYMNGVSTLDLVKIQRHILGLEELDSPYKLIAADVNADDQVKASDLTQLRKLILGVITDLPTNESWRFVDGGQSMSMDMDLSNINYTMELENIQGNSFGNDLVAVKVGDVTDNAVANLNSTTTEVRSNKTLELMIDNQEVEVGEKVSVAFTSADFTEVFGYQFTMELKGLTFAGIENGVVEMTEGNVGVLTSNVLTMSYNSSIAINASKEATIFTIDFIATEKGSLSEMIEITSKVTRSEAYVTNGLEIREVVIETRGAITAVEATELYQNEPNPFKGQTVVGFNLAEAGSATMTVFDVTGKVLVKENIAGVKGYNTVNFTAEQLGASGVLYYTLESGDFTATKKMIIIE